MVIPDQSTGSADTMGNICDYGIVFSLCALIFFLPGSIALLEIFTILAIFFYFVKKINRIAVDWPLKISSLGFSGRVHFIRETFASPASVLNRPLQFLTAAVLVSVLFSQYPALSLTAFITKFLKCMFLYFCFIEAFSNEKRIRIFLIILLLSAFITVLGGIIEHYTGQGFFKWHFTSGERVNSFFKTANGLGAYLVPVIGLTTHFLYSALVKRKSWMLGGVLAVLLALLLACLCWTYSRSSWIGYLVVLFVMVSLDWRKLLFAGALLLIFILIFPPSLSNVRHMDLIRDDKGGIQTEESLQSVLADTGSGRFGFWKKAISITLTSPIYGTGLNTYGKIIKQDPDPKTWWYAHNCYLQMAAETGLLGVACFLWMLFVLLWHGIKYSSHRGFSWPLAFLQGTVAGLSGFLVQSFFDNTFYTVQLGTLMWVIFGLMVAVVRLMPPAEGFARSL